MTERQKQFFKIEQKLAWLMVLMICTAAILIGIGGIYLLVYFQEKNLKHLVLSLLFLLISVAAITLFYKYYKSKKFDQSPMEPNIYVLKKMNYQGVNKAVKDYFGELNDICDLEDLKGSYVCVKKFGLELRVLLLRISDFNKVSFKNSKSKLNKIINKNEDYTEMVQVDQGSKMMRVNFVVIDTLNEYAKQLMSENAVGLMRRVEGIVNIIYCECENRLYIPTHYGLEGYTKYHKVHRMMLNCLENYIIND